MTPPCVDLLPYISWVECFEQNKARMVEIELEDTIKYLKRQLSNSTFKNITIDLKPTEHFSGSIIYFPMYVCTYSYGGRTYYFVVNGQTGDMSGDRPYAEIPYFPGLTSKALSWGQWFLYSNKGEKKSDSN
eukprot:TRINITY_DN4368_c0_g1_i2.p1 TRINITY_DN4368_c0_g1~~TRINITY_DN4368_c0_g1_i2.p1  ORF type:complete len:131 (+),score=4.52 TRINITY_DN4368_c0_g1_i2:177-569(+)